MAWIARRGARWPPGDVLPLVLLEAPCAFRTAALAALDRAGVRWHVAFTSQSLSGIWAAVGAGLGVTVRTPAGVPRGLAVLDSTAGLPPLPSIALWLHESPASASPLVAELRALLVRSISAVLPAPGPARRPRRRAPARRAELRR